MSGKGKQSSQINTKINPPTSDHPSLTSEILTMSPAMLRMSSNVIKISPNTKRKPTDLLKSSSDILRILPDTFSTHQHPPHPHQHPPHPPRMSSEIVNMATPPYVMNSSPKKQEASHRVPESPKMCNRHITNAAQKKNLRILMESTLQTDKLDSTLGLDSTLQPRVKAIRPRVQAVKPRVQAIIPRVQTKGTRVQSPPSVLSCPTASSSTSATCLQNVQTSNLEKNQSTKGRRISFYFENQNKQFAMTSIRC